MNASRSIKRIKRQVGYLASDVAGLVSGRARNLTPSADLMFVGGGNFKKIGREFFEYFVDLGGMGRTDKVLDVGCGVGRMAVPLTRYITPPGSYEGFDVVPAGIDWCLQKITIKYPHFNFQPTGVYNKVYNPQGRHKASEYRFPFEDDSFDFVYAVSVFTHILPEDAANYVAETARVLRSGGRCLITFFLLTAASIHLIEQGKSSLDFKDAIDGSKTINKDRPEEAVAYDESWVRNIYNKHGLILNEPIRYGSWCGRERYLSYQDVVIAVKKSL